MLILIPISTSALSLEEVWNIVARWAKETFSFVSGENSEISEPRMEDEDDYSTLQELLALSNRDPSIVPMWIPDGFSLIRIEKDSAPIQETYTAIYQDGDKELTIQVRTHLSLDVQNNEIENDPIEIYPHDGIDYYIFENVDQLRVVWLVDSYECLISGDVSIDELKMMIDSIQKG